jgi:hypothetical protein
MHVTAKQTESLKTQVELLRKEYIGEMVTVMSMSFGKPAADKGVLKAVNGFSSIEIKIEDSPADLLSAKNGTAIVTMTGAGIPPVGNSSAMFTISGNGVPFSRCISPSAIAIYPGADASSFDRSYYVKKLYFVGYGSAIVEILKGNSRVYYNACISTDNCDLTREDHIDKAISRSFGEDVLGEIVQQRNLQRKTLDEEQISL